MSQVGRISGPLLFANLERNGIDLAFRNDLQTTQLLYLDVENQSIGVNTDSPSVSFSTSGLSRTSDFISQTADISNLSINANEISASIGDINLDAREAVVFATFTNNVLTIDNNVVKTDTADTNIEILPNSAAETNIQSNLNVTGDIFTLGDITLEGSITFGDQSQDTVTFESDIDSDLIPNTSNTAKLGSSNKRWQDLYTRLLNGETVTTSNINVGGLDYTFRQGNIFFVDQNGNDANTGDHPQDPFRTLKRALEAADASVQGPVAVLVGPGEFQEELPLEVPNNVTVSGYDIRNTIIKPAAGFESNDVFLLDGETIVQHLTISDFLSQGSDHYAFRFRPGATISKRSPYVQNVTVLTFGSTRTADDPRGFNSGDAGGGAFIDGSEVDPSAVSASMLFQSVTFLTPNANGLVMTNGVRVEWLTSFTYFADKAIFAFNGATGRVSEDGSTVNFGAELRSIGSANIYGNKAVIADGDDCLFYLINHNFAYVGTGRRADNDDTLVIEENQITKLNGGEIYFTSIDERGKYKVGDDFFVDFDTGTTTIDANDVNADSFTQLNFVDDDSETLINSNQVRTGLIKFSDNDLVSLSKDINLSSENDLNINSNTNVTNNISMTGNFSFDGSLNLLGNQTSDTITFNVDIDQDFLPNQDSKFSLGSIFKEWNKVYLSEATIDSLSINDNYIQTVESNADLELRSSGVGSVVMRNDVDISDNLTVEGNTTLNQAAFNNLNLQKSFITSGEVSISQDVSLAQTLAVGSYADFENISIQGNAVYTTESNSDLEFRSNATGKIRSRAPVVINRDLFSKNTNTFNNIQIEGLVASPRLTFSDVFIDTNYFETDNVNLLLGANGVGLVSLSGIDFVHDVLSTKTENVKLSPNQNLNIQSTGSLQIPVGPTGYSGSTGDIRFNQTESLFEAFNSSQITFGGVFSDDRKTSVTIDTTSDKIDFTVGSVSVGSVTSTGLQISKIFVDDITVDENRIQTKTMDQDLVLDRNGSGAAVIDNTRIQGREIQNTLANGLLTFQPTDLGYVKFNTETGVVIPFGDTASQDSDPPEGDVRYNTETNLMEVYNGVDYVSAAGTSASISEEDYNELVELFTLVLG